MHETQVIVGMTIKTVCDCFKYKLNVETIKNQLFSQLDVKAFILIPSQIN